MDTNTENAIYHLMQNVIDKLNIIENKINEKVNLKTDEKKSTEIEELNAIIEHSVSSIEKSLKASQQQITKILMSINERVNVVPNVNHYKEFSLFGKQTNVKPKRVYFAIICLVIVWFSIKYLPKYYIEHSQLKKDKIVFQTFYEYTFLNQFSNSKTITADEILKKIKIKDTLLMKDYNKLYRDFSIEMRKRELEKALQNLEK